MTRLLFRIVPLAIIAGLIFMVYSGISKYLSITGEIAQVPQDLEIEAMVQGKVFWPKVLRNNAAPIWIEMELSDLDRKVGETHRVTVHATDDCDYIEIIDNAEEIVFEDQGKTKQTRKIPITFRNVNPAMKCTIQLQIEHQNSSRIELSRSLPVDALSTKIIAIGSTLMGFIALLFTFKILK